MEAVRSVEASNRSAWVRRAIALSWFTILYNVVEGAVSIAYGIGDDSTSLIGFGVDSLIEVASAFLVLWRFRDEMGSGVTSVDIDRERKATRGIGYLFVGLAVFTAVSAAVQLYTRNHPETTVPGVIVSALSLSFMFYLWSSKKKAARALMSKTMEKDAHCSLACIQLSVILFIGSVTFVFFPHLWWADGIASLALSCFIGREGFETLRAANSEEFDIGCGYK